MSEWLGWIATGVFAASYLFRGPRSIRIVQAIGAGLWIVYGLLLGLRPVVLANLLVGALALASLWRDVRGSRRDRPETRRARFWPRRHRATEASF